MGILQGSDWDGKRDSDVDCNRHSSDLRGLDAGRSPTSVASPTRLPGIGRTTTSKRFPEIPDRFTQEPVGMKRITNEVRLRSFV